MQVLSGLRWQLLARPLGFRGSIWRFTAFYFIGMYFNLLLPTSVGGDVIRTPIPERPGTSETGRVSDRVGRPRHGPFDIVAGCLRRRIGKPNSAQVLDCAQRRRNDGGGSRGHITACVPPHAGQDVSNGSGDCAITLSSICACHV